MRQNGECKKHHDYYQYRHRKKNENEKKNNKIKKCYTHKQVKIFSIYITGSCNKEKNKILKYI